MQQFEREWTPERKLLILPIEKIRFAQNRLRADVDDDAIRTLAESIRLYGLISPLTVRSCADGGYELIAGERRLRAMTSLGMHFADAFIVDTCDMDACFMALVENLQREQLNYMEEAEAFRAMIRDYKLSQQELANRIGRSQPMVANRLRLLTLPHGVRRLVTELGLSERHARALLSLPNEGLQIQAARAAHEKQLSVREFESLILRMGAKPKRVPKLYVRDHRMFVNTVMDAVRALKSLGIDAASRIVDEPDRIEIIVTLPKVLR